MDTIGEYFVRRLIGEGGMGKVYEAEERLSKRRVALKVLRRDLAESPDGRRLFLREMQILSQLDHPNVVRCLACTDTGGDLVMALEFLDGHTLRDVLRHHGRLPWVEAARIAGEIAAALGAAHGQPAPIVHRDLKPENIMITSAGPTKVMDFGIAKVLDAVAPQTVHTVGTLSYMSPEQIDGKQIDPRADLYALGLVLYEMLVGRPPFDSESPRELLHAQVTQPPPPVPHEVRYTLPPGLEELMLQLLEKDPAARPPTAQDVQLRLQNLGRPVPTANPAPAPAPAPAGGAAGHAAPAPDAGPPMGTIMLVERAQARRKRRGVGLLIALIAIPVVVALGGGSYYLLAYRSVSAPDPTPAESVDKDPKPDKPKKKKDPKPEATKDPEPKVGPDKDPEPKVGPDKDPEPKTGPAKDPEPDPPKKKGGLMSKVFGGGDDDDNSEDSKSGSILTSLSGGDEDE